MGKIKTVIAGLSVLLALVGCEKRSPSSQSLSPAVQEFMQVLAKNQKLTFLSYDGKWMGTDGDADITFLLGERVEMTRYGFAVQHYSGTYQMDGTGMIVVKLVNYGEWDPMQLERDQKSLILHSKAKEGANRRSWWPFRMVDKAPFDLPATQP